LLLVLPSLEVGLEVEKEEQQALILVTLPLPSFQVVVEVVDHCLKQVLIPLALLRY
jgi:hypothetical protein